MAGLSWVQMSQQDSIFVSGNQVRSCLESLAFTKTIQFVKTLGGAMARQLISFFHAEAKPLCCAASCCATWLKARGRRKCEDSSHPAAII